MVCCFQDLFKLVCSILVQFPSSVSLCVLLASMWYINAVVLTQPQLEISPYNFIRDKTSIWSITFWLQFMHSCIFTSLSVDVALLPMHVILFTNFRRSPLRVEITPSNLKDIGSILFAFTWNPMSPVVCSRLWSRDSAWIYLFARIAIWSPSVIVSAWYSLLWAFFSV